MSSVLLVAEDGRSIDFEPDLLTAIPEIAALIESGEAFSESLETTANYQDLVEYRNYLLGDNADIDAVIRAADSIRDDLTMEELAYSQLGPNFEDWLANSGYELYTDMLHSYSKVPLRVINACIKLSRPETCIFVDRLQGLVRIASGNTDLNQGSASSQADEYETFFIGRLKKGKRARGHELDDILDLEEVVSELRADVPTQQGRDYEPVGSPLPETLKKDLEAETSLYPRRERKGKSLFPFASSAENKLDFLLITNSKKDSKSKKVVLNVPAGRDPTKYPIYDLYSGGGKVIESTYIRAFRTEGRFNKRTQKYMESQLVIDAMQYLTGDGRTFEVQNPELIVALENDSDEHKYVFDAVRSIVAVDTTVGLGQVSGKFVYRKVRWLDLNTGSEQELKVELPNADYRLLAVHKNVLAFVAIDFGLVIYNVDSKESFLLNVPLSADKTSCISVDNGLVIWTGSYSLYLELLGLDVAEALPVWEWHDLYSLIRDGLEWQTVPHPPNRWFDIIDASVITTKRRR